MLEMNNVWQFLYVLRFLPEKRKGIILALKKYYSSEIIWGGTWKNTQIQYPFTALTH